MTADEARILALGAAGVAAVAAWAGFTRHPRGLAVAALALWVLAYLAGFSIGRWLLASAFVLLAVAVAGAEPRPARRWAAAGLGLAAWWAVTAAVDDAWWFLPARLVLRHLLGAP